MSGVKHRESGERQCAVTRRSLPKGRLLRFVMSPDGEVVPDLKETLPGRGVWTLCDRAVVEDAASKGHFKRGFKADVKISGDLAGLAGRLLEERALAAMALCRKAGQLVTGFSKCDTAIRSGEAVLLIHATDAADDGIRKLANACAFAGHLGAEEIEVFRLWSIDAMSRALGLENAVRAVALHGGATANLKHELERFRAWSGAATQSGGPDPVQADTK